MKALSKLDDDSIGIWKKIFRQIRERPDNLANIFLTQFVPKYYKNVKGEHVQHEEPRVIWYRSYDIVSNCN